ncbi:serine/threonine-protein kinase haspin [Cyprinodon tularosa]|uniref:serine/threonine-protein kinase haspin n=1 Tax=Cyprinodon tularosa TaxID=77115 RepID=UPI0018E22E73|nr:serine/threonine-protein kinase haspin [Cyprinodon tularosa]
MASFKPRILKTYGKQKRKVSAWLSPEDRRKFFDSTPSSEDISVFQAAEPSKPREKCTKVGRRRPQGSTRKTTTMQSLIEKICDEEYLSDAENCVPSPLGPLQSKKKGGKNRSLARRKQRAVLCPVETRSNEDNCMRQLSSTKKRKARISRQASASVSTRRRGNTSESEEETATTKLQKVQEKSTVESNVCLRSAGRYVTRRRRGATTKPPDAIVGLLNSSDDFTSGPFGSSMYQKPTRRKRAPPVFKLSSDESSVNPGRTNNLFREISLNELAEHSLGPVQSRPIFCSTPSAPTFNQQRCPKLRRQVVSPLSELGSSIRTPSALQKDQDSLPKLESPHVEQKESSLHQNEEMSLDLFDESDRGVGSAYDKPRSVDTEGRKSSDLNLLCTVQIKRVNSSHMPQLSSQTTYLSCLESSVSENKQAITPREWTSAVGFYPEQSAGRGVMATEKTGNYAPSVRNLAASASASHGHMTPESPELFSREANMEHSESLIYVDDTQDSDEKIAERQLSASSAVATQLTDGESETEKRLKSKCIKKCLVLVKSLVICSANPHEQTEGAVLLSESENLPEAKAELHTLEEVAALATELKEKALTSRAVIKVKKLTRSELTDILLPKGDANKSSTTVSDSSNDNRRKTCSPSDSKCSEDTASLKVASESSSSDKEVEKVTKSFPKRDKKCLVPKEKRRRSPSADSSGTTRKACVSGLSVSRWKNKGGASTLASRNKQGRAFSAAVDNSINELISKHRNHSNDYLGAAINFSTPLRTSRLNLSSLLADLTPRTHTWSRLKAALSVHRKGILQLTPSHLDKSVTCTPRRFGLSDVRQGLLSSPGCSPLLRCLKSQLGSPHSLAVGEDFDLTDAQKVYAECGQSGPLPWEECILPSRMKRCVKIGEGTFGEVFSTTNAAGDMVALKIIPVEGSEKVNGEDQKTFGEILHEIIISKELSSLKEKQQNQTHGFIGLNDLHCVQGCYPLDFLRAWDGFDQLKGSENDRPDFFEKDQLFIILEFEFGGTDLENSNGTLASLAVAKSVLHQVTAALAVAEQELHFEHRDLHWGNVLVKTTREKMGSFFLNGTSHSLETKGVLVRIIDYSLSRLEIDDLTVSCDISDDEELFMGQGDYQFEIYRLMRAENGNEWSSYHPHTNVLWLHYLCSKLLSMKYKTARGKGIKTVREELKHFSESVLMYTSATDVLQNCPIFQ